MQEIDYKLNIMANFLRIESHSFEAHVTTKLLIQMGAKNVEIDLSASVIKGQIPF